MASTAITSGGTGSVVRYQGEMLADEARKIDWLVAQGLVGKGENFAIQELDDLSKDKGDSVVVYLAMKGVGAGIDSDGDQEGNEEALVIYQDQLYIGRKSHAFKIDGELSEQRTAIDLRKLSRSRLALWWGEYHPELAMIMLSGILGNNTNGVIQSGSTFLGNSLRTPDSDHVVYANSLGTSAGMTTADVMSLAWIDKLVAKAKMLSPQVRPMKVNGQDRYALILSPYQVRDLRASAGSDWREIQMAKLQGGSGDNNPLITGALGMYNQTLLYESQDVRTLATYGASNNVAIARALFLGAQAAARYFGKGHSKQYKYVEKTFQYNSKVGFAGSCIFGIQKLRFNSKDLGVIALDTAAAA